MPPLPNRQPEAPDFFMDPKLNTDAVGAEGGRSPRLRTILARLDEIRRDLDRDDLDLEDQLQLYREGCTLAAQAKKILDTTRAEVEFLMAESDGPGSNAEVADTSSTRPAGT
jgi:exodeoxyribonuclease VII small subunit